MLDDLMESLSKTFVSRQHGEGLELVSGVSLTTKSVAAYCAIMNHVRHHIRQHGLESAIHGPDTFSGLDYFTWKRANVISKPITGSGEKVLETISKDAIAVNMVCTSSRDNTDTPHEQGSLASTDKQSLWAELLKLSQKTDSEKQEEGGSSVPVVRTRKVGKICWPDLDKVAAYTNLSLPGCMKFDDFACKYYLRRFVKRGSYGSVYTGETISGACVGVKVMLSQEGSLCGREVALHKHCSAHPNVVDVIDGFVSAFYMVLVMPLAYTNLHQYLQETTLMSECATSMTKDLAAGLAHIHAMGVIHRDCHSGNILVIRLSCGVSHVSLQWTDFGMACLCGKDAERAKVLMSITIVGGYNCPPEIVFLPTSTKRAVYTSAVDVWCFGCIAIEIGAGGQPPFANPRGRQGLRDKIIDLFGTPLPDIVKKYGWVDVPERPSVESINWGLWHCDRHRATLQHTLRYDMTRRPDMQTVFLAFSSASEGGGVSSASCS